MTHDSHAKDDVRDEVDSIVAAWSSIHPELDAAPLAIFSRLVRLSRFIERMRKTVFANHSLETWEFEMLAALRRAEGNRMTAGRLMKETLVSSGTVTNRLDRMEAKGLLNRAPDSSDGRIVHVHATELGLTRVDAAMKELVAVEAEIIAPYADKENAQAAHYLRTLLRYFEDAK